MSTKPNNVTTLPSAENTLTQLTPKTMDEALRFSEILAKSSIVPKDYQGNPGNVLVAVQWGAEIGLPPLQAMQNIAVINGRPSIWGDAMIALVRGSGLLESIEETLSEDGESATCTVKRRGEAPVTRTFTMEDAKIAGLAGKQGPWRQYPKRMLQMRARSWALRDVFPDVLRGVHIAEEAQDMPPEKLVEGEVLEKEPAKSPAEKARKAIANRRQKKTADKKPDTNKQPGELIPIPLSDVLDAISQADSLRALNAAAELAGRLTEDADIKQARHAWKEKKAVLEAESAPQGPTFAEIADRIQKAVDSDQLAEACDLIRSIEDPQQRAELEQIATDRGNQIIAGA